MTTYTIIDTATNAPLMPCFVEIESKSFAEMVCANFNGGAPSDPECVIVENTL